MSGFTVFQDSYIGATIVSNRFIDEYMTEANDAQLKVYLYLVRMLNAHLETSLGDIADRFNHTEKDVIRAFKYWEKKGLLTIDYDGDNNIAGVHLVNLCKGDSNGPTVESTHKSVKVSAPSVSKKDTISDAEAAKTEEPMVNGTVSSDEYTENSVAIPMKPSFGAKELSGFSNKGGKQLVFLAQAYFGKPVTQTDLQTLAYISQILEFSDDLVDYLLQYCAEKGKKDFRYAEKVAIGWKQNGVETPEQAKGASLRYDRGVYDIMKRLGKSGSPTVKEMEYITSWRDKDGFSDELIMEACDRAVLNTDSNRFSYVQGILNKWKAQNITNLDDVKRVDEEFKKSTAQSSSHSASPKKNSAGSFGNYKQNDIDYDELSKKIYAN
ncbi:MAG: DnaD domain protein [Lachnospiraceae bacterium]|nr:DnaD domain protein [Lachnospiraceae bacterium]